MRSQRLPPPTSYVLPAEFLQKLPADSSVQSGPNHECWAVAKGSGPCRKVERNYAVGNSPLQCDGTNTGPSVESAVHVHV